MSVSIPQHRVVHRLLNLMLLVISRYRKVSAIQVTHAEGFRYVLTLAVSHSFRWFTLCMEDMEYDYRYMVFCATFNYFPNTKGMVPLFLCTHENINSPRETFPAITLRVGRPIVETTINTSKSLTYTGASSLVRAVPPGVKSTPGSSDVREADLLESNHCHSAHASMHQNQE